MWAMCGQRAGNVRATSAPRLGNSVPPWEPKTTTGGLDWSFLGPVPVPTIDGPLRSEGGHFKVTSDHCPGHVGAPFGQQLAALGTKNHDRVPGLEFLGPCPGPYNRWFAQERKGSISRLLLTTAPVAEHRGVPFTFLPRAHISKPCARCAIWNRTGGAPRPPKGATIMELHLILRSFSKRTKNAPGYCAGQLWVLKSRAALAAARNNTRDSPRDPPRSARRRAPGG